MEDYPQKTKVLGYILKQANDRTQILVFRHRDYPEAGLQVPGGTLEKGEAPKAGLLREIREEAGLTAFRTITYLGQSTYVAHQKQEKHNRHFFALWYAGNKVHEYSFRVTAGKADKGLVLHYQWIDIAQLPPLAANQDCMLRFIPLSS